MKTLSRRLLIGISILTTLSTAFSPAAAQQTEAEMLLGLRQFPQAHHKALADIETGEREGSELALLYRVLALASASLEDGADVARRAFIWLLVLQPEFRLASDWPLQVRSAYMEAKGEVAGHAPSLAALGQLAADESSWLVRLDDPFKLVARLRLRVRLEGERQFVETVRVPAPQVAFPLPANPERRALEYTLTLLDQHGNRILHQGSDETPEVVVWPGAEARGERAAVPRAAEPIKKANGGGFMVAAATSLMVAGAAAVVGAFRHAERERLAGRWNEARCAGTGNTRGEICKDERDSMLRAERTAEIAYGISGVSLIASVLLFVAARSETRSGAKQREALAKAVRCTNGPVNWGLSCATRF